MDESCEIDKLESDQGILNEIKRGERILHQSFNPHVNEGCDD